MEQEILTGDQKKAIATVNAEPALSDFYLTGGTALAGYYLYHRLSEDLDFFVFKKPDSIFLHAFVEKLKNELNAFSIRYEKLYDRHQFFFTLSDEELKIEFTQYPFPQLEKPSVKENVKIDSIRDISANKIMALLDRFDPKDFVDLFFLLQNRNLEDLRRDAEKKFDVKIDPVFLAGELAKVRRIVSLPRMIKPITVEELKDFFGEQIKKLSPEVFS